MLQNPIYLGEIRHKKLTFSGQHQAILKSDLFDRVQKLLAAKGGETAVPVAPPAAHAVPLAALPLDELLAIRALLVDALA